MRERRAREALARRDSGWLRIAAALDLSCLVASSMYLFQQNTARQKDRTSPKIHRIQSESICRAVTVYSISLSHSTHTNRNTHNRRCSACIDPLHASLSLRRAGVPLTAHAHPEPPHHRIAPTPVSSLAHHPPITITQQHKGKKQGARPARHLTTSLPPHRPRDGSSLSHCTLTPPQ